MASFGWKRKIGEKVSKETSQNFEKESAEEDRIIENDDVDWLHYVKRKKGILLEDNITKSKHLKDEGALLALNGRYWEAVKKWDEGIQLTPEDATLYEMKSQSLLCLHEIFPAVQSAETAVKRNPHFVEAWQTLGRAQLELGEIVMAIRSFQVAVHLCPSNTELWEEDLNWARQLLQQKREVKGEDLHSNGRDSCIESIPDYDFESDEVVAVCDAISQRQKKASKNTTVVVSSSEEEPCQESANDNTTSSKDPTSYIKAR
ncbi:PREDICTED: tetratricopeptide repeat protein 33 [Nanorana parkeri]|uniref:tetratricopeptide repeat protein 33 n=1 Tax=Nanorana parkeri TaxID=125878 RepID=UPI0008549526|nr:PREDICTED: tetratricopeptide repeat protein 33 [Nanorana parkeri]